MAQSGAPEDRYGSRASRFPGGAFDDGDCTHPIHIAGKVCFFALKAREFDVKDVVTDPDSGSNASDDAMISVLEDHPDDPTHQELRSFIDALTEDEQVDLVALTWLGRGDGTIDEWDDLRQEAARLHNNRTAAYLLGKPMLADHLEEGLSQFGCSCEDYQGSWT
jgi:Protein of unknown function (DUF3775)